MSKAKSTASSAKPTPIICVAKDGVSDVGLDAGSVAWAKANGFDGQLGRLLPLPGANGKRDGFLFGLGAPENRPKLATGLAAAALEPGAYTLKGTIDDPLLAGLGFDLGAYKFNRYKSTNGSPDVGVTRTPIAGADEAEIARLRDAAYIARDLINTPPSDLGPDAFEAEIRAFAKARKMSVKAIVGDDLLTKNFPMIHAVGRASAQAPRLLDLTWGPKNAPKVTLVGKGVTFDTGGLDIKSAAGMVLMKKDMGGAANILGLAHTIVDAKLKLRLRVLLPVVENAISANAFRPGDILHSRAGLSIEIGNTDAEGRLILADALALADEESPELIIDMATLTGAARVALGADLPALYANDMALAQQMQAAGAVSDDPVWHMPLWQPYEKMLNSKIADVSHIGSGPLGGSITAALFLQRFVKNAGAWAHLDINGWTPEARPGRPWGGTDHGIRACFGMLAKRYG